MSPKIPKIDTDKCIGCVLCTQICPEVYEMAEDGKSHVKNTSGATEESIQQSAEACPVGCISIMEE